MKSAAAPKFKGTMLMMNQPGVPAAQGTPPPPQATPGRPAGGLPPPPGAGAAPSKLRGTMVGVAPMGGTPLPPPPTPTNSPPPNPGNAGQGGPGGYGGHGGGEAASAFSPPVPQAGVNPLGGTVAADAGMFGAFAAHQQQPGAPHQPGGGPPAYGAPPRGYAGGSGPPPAGPLGPGPGYGYGAPPPGGPPGPQPPPYGQPYGSSPPAGGPLPPAYPPPFGVPPPPPPPGAVPYGASPYAGPPSAYGGGDAHGAPQGQPPAGHAPGMHPLAHPPAGQGMLPYQPPGGPMVGTLKSSGTAPTAPTRRNALMTLLLPLAVMFGGSILSGILAAIISPGLASLGTLFVLAGYVWYLLLAVQMVNELKSVTRSEELVWWPLIVPLYQLYFMWIVVPQEVAKAKQLLGVRQPPQNILFYVFLWHFALATDINDMVR